MHVLDNTFTIICVHCMHVLDNTFTIISVLEGTYACASQHIYQCAEQHTTTMCYETPLGVLNVKCNSTL